MEAGRRYKSAVPVKPHPFDPVDDKRDIRISGLIAGICILTGFVLIFFTGILGCKLLALMLLFAGLVALLACGASIGERRSHRQAATVGAGQDISEPPD